ncbi:MAG: efflux RND transporter permease subunit [Verrucomicrobia bacterium]|nr:efflux RND transporter permease subunit [Verrucomicrobiota bacterium]
MIDALIGWSLRNRAAVLTMAALLLVIGGYTAMNMPVDVFPDLTAPTVTVITEAKGMAPAEVETQVTFPIEAAVNGASGVRRVRSATAVGLSIVWIEFDWGTDIYAARQIVSEKVNVAASELPPEVDRPVLAPVSSIMGEILFLSLTSDQHTPIELRTTADTVIRRRILSVPGVSQVTPIGGGVKQFQVLLPPAKLLAHRVSLSQVTRALEEGNENVSAGFLNERSAEWLITGVGRVRSLEDIGETVVVARDGVPTQVADLGAVVIGEEPKRGEGSTRGQPAVILGIQKQPGANTLKLTQELDAVLDDIAAKLPAGMAIDRHIFRQADFIEVAIQNIMAALRDGGLLVVAIVLLFLANIRATFITLTAIPLSLGVTVLVMKAFGATMNTMTLGGMAIAIGALVDDAVILVENVFRRLRLNTLQPEGQRHPATHVVFAASIEIQKSIVFATLIIGLVFLPIFFLSGVEGRLLKPLGVAYIVSLGASLLVALMVSPVLCDRLLPTSQAVLTGQEPKVVTWLKSHYSTILNPVLNHPWRVTIPAAVALVLALGSTFAMGRSFLPEFNEGTLTLSAVTLPGTSLEQANEYGTLIERTLLSHPEVTGVARRQGRAELDEHAQGVESAEIDVSLKMQRRSKEEFLEALRRDFSLIPGLNVIIGQPISHRIDHMLSGTRANIAVKIFGDNLYQLRLLANRARQEMEAVPGVVDLSIEQQTEVPILRAHFDRNAIARHGLSVRQVAQTMEAAIKGVTVSRVLEGRNSFDLVVRLTGPEGWQLDNLGELLVDTPAGARVPLRSLADLRKETGPNYISREQVERKIVVMCNAGGRDVTSIVNDCKKVVDPLVAGLPGYRVAYSGQFESAAEAGRIVALLGIAVVLGIGFLLHLAFGSGRDAALVMLNLPLALIGGVVGVFVSGGVLSVASLIGFITVFGIATRNGIMLVSHIKHLAEHEGVTALREAVFRGALERLAPILMTALAAGLALIPLALSGHKPGSEIQTPMAIVILFGLLSSMLLNMIVVPTLYLRFGRPVAAQ